MLQHIYFKLPNTFNECQFCVMLKSMNINQNNLKLLKLS